MRYTPEEVERLHEVYVPAEDKDEAIAILIEELGRSKESIIAKLISEGVYIKKRYLTKDGKVPVVKKELIAQLASLVNGDLGKLQGLEKSSKMSLEYLLELLST